MLKAGPVYLLLGFLAATPILAEEAEPPAGGWAELVGIPNPEDAISPEQRAHIERVVAAYEAKTRKPGLQTGADGEPLLYPFFPQAGVLGRDLFLNNFTDQDPARELIRDWDCSDYTYDGHQGHDSLIRTFREQLIGVPVFAVRDGVVVDTHDGEPDMNTQQATTNKANYVIVDHGSGIIAWYFHFKAGSVAVAPGQAVAAGTQLGLTGSSGFSNWPHLHFETRRNGTWYEPSSGPCRTGDSLWASQPPVMRDFYVADFLLSPGELSIPSFEAFLLDEAPRTGTFAKGRQVFSVRVDLRNLPSSSPYRATVLSPRGKAATEIEGVFDDVYQTLALGLFHFDVDLDAPGTWRLRLEINGETAVEAPFLVVNTAKQVKNRAPKKVTAKLSPKSPMEGQVMTCEVQTSLVTEDPDYDVVSYRYEWKVNGRVVRAVTSAALTDLLPAGTAKGKDKVSCKVVPSDGKKSGPATVAGRAVDGE
jgi:murein DD-endopeptidase MepM/ murein hydrolase activator NlpD